MSIVALGRLALVSRMRRYHGQGQDAVQAQGAAARRHTCAVARRVVTVLPSTGRSTRDVALAPTPRERDPSYPHPLDV